MRALTTKVRFILAYAGSFDPTASSSTSYICSYITSFTFPSKFKKIFSTEEVSKAPKSWTIHPSLPLNTTSGFKWYCRIPRASGTNRSLIYSVGIFTFLPNRSTMTCDLGTDSSGSLLPSEIWLTVSFVALFLRLWVQNSQRSDYWLGQNSSYGTKFMVYFAANRTTSSKALLSGNILLFIGDERTSMACRNYFWSI